MDSTDLKHPEKSEKSGKLDIPNSRITNVWQAWSVCDELEKQDQGVGTNSEKTRGRAGKRGRIFKAYNLFPPSDYSTLFEISSEYQSNVPFGMLRYRVNNSISSFVDMLTERHRTCEIKTKKGSVKERSVWSDLISSAFDKSLNAWDDRLMNQEQGLLDMHLYSKGLECWEDLEGCVTCHVPADDVLIPNGTKISFKNFDILAIKKKYTLHELFEKIQSGAGTAGWNEKAVLMAIKHQKEEWGKQTDDEWLKDVQEGNIFLGGQLKEHVDCYVLYVKEFRKTGHKISKFVLLRNYGYAVELAKKGNPTGKVEKIEQETLKKQDFLFQKVDFADKIQDIFAVFMDSAGSGKWHAVPSLAESIFVQCRQYDFVMNSVMDAVRMNMCLMVQATTADAEEKLKELVFGSFLVIPSDVPFVQQRLALPTNEAVNTIQFMMLDMFQGIGEYRVQERAKGGEAQTATQTQIDAATTAKLTGTQLKRYAAQEKVYYTTFYKKLVSLKKGEKDYELLEKFKDCLREYKVPEEAWKFENIESITANVLAGAGSPAYKLNAALKIIEITNISPKSEGQANAMQDAIAAYATRDNVGRYFNITMPDKSFNEKLAGYENAMLSDKFLDPKSVQVNPDDEDEYHLNIHLTDMERTIALVNEKLEAQTLTDSISEDAAYKVLNEGAHCLAHIENLARDKTKENVVKMATRRLNVIQGLADKMGKEIQAQKESKQQGFDPSKDPDIAKKVAMGQLEVSIAEKLGQIKQANIASSHQQKLQANEEKSAQEIAAIRVKQEEESKKQESKPSKSKAK